MINLATDPPPSAATERALSFISKGWSTVRDSADADLKLMRARASSFKSLADRELENFLHSALLPASTPSQSSSASLDFVKRIRRAYSSPDFSKKMLEQWTPSARIRLDLSMFRSAIVEEVEGEGERKVRRRVRWKGEMEEREWEPVRRLRRRLKEIERKGFGSGEFVEKVKLSLEDLRPFLDLQRRPKDRVLRPRRSIKSRRNKPIARFPIRQDLDK